MKKILTSLALVASLAIPAHAQWAMTCTWDPNSSVNLRNGPSRSNRIVASIPANSYLRVMNWVWGSDNLRWYRVEFDGLVGWMRSDHLCR